MDYLDYYAQKEDMPFEGIRLERRQNVGLGEGQISETVETVERDR